jgi:5-methylcytosine-specific restriction enzyme A
MPRRPPVYRPPHYVAPEQRRKEYESTEARKESRAFYSSKRWVTFRAWLLRQPGNRFCKDCRGAGRLTLTQTFHHERPRLRFPELAFDESNLTPLCFSCHSRREAKLRGGFR